MDELHQDQLRSSLIYYSGSLENFEEVQKVLLQQDFNKHNGIRFLCWMIRTNLIKSLRSSWIESFSSLYKDYSAKAEIYFSNPNLNPLDSIPARVAHVVRSDITRTKSWFMKCASQIGLQPNNIEDSDKRAERIISLIQNDSKKFNYTQGHDRFVWISLLLGLFFSSNGGLNNNFAEAMGYHLSKALISMIKISKYIENYERIEKHFAKVDKLLALKKPNIAHILRCCGNSSIHFAMKWELTWFAEEYQANELMFLWDQIIARLEDLDEFMRCLVVAHVSQVPIPHNKDEMAICIQKNKKWDVIRAINDAINYIYTDESDWNVFKSIYRLLGSYCGPCRQQFI